MHKTYKSHSPPWTDSEKYIYMAVIPEVPLNFRGQHLYKVFS